MLNSNQLTKLTVDLDQLKKRCNDPINTFRSLGEYTNGYTFIDNNATILAVGHLDTVLPKIRHFNLGKNKVYTPQLDDRLGVYTLLDVLPTMGLKYDVLLTEDEESMQSTAQFFDPPRDYNWIFELDRAGDDVVLYDYDTPENRARCVNAGWRVSYGSYSDICDLGHLERAAFNFGIGYHGQHTVYCYMDVREWEYDVKRFVKFYNMHKDTVMEHDSFEYEPAWAWKDDVYYGGKHKAYTYSKGVYRDDKCYLCDTYYVDEENQESLLTNGYCVECNIWLDNILKGAKQRKHRIDFDK